MFPKYDNLLVLENSKKLHSDPQSYFKNKVFCSHTHTTACTSLHIHSPTHHTSTLAYLHVHTSAPTLLYISTPSHHSSTPTHSHLHMLTSILHTLHTHTWSLLYYLHDYTGFNIRVCLSSGWLFLLHAFESELGDGGVTAGGRSQPNTHKSMCLCVCACVCAWHACML